MKRIILFCLFIIFATILTILTQIGGILLLLSLIIYYTLIKRRFISVNQQRILGVLSFLLLYILSIFILIPPLAKINGRVPLPLTLYKNIQPVTIWTCLLNRNYVRPNLKYTLEDIAQALKNEFPNAEIRYLDANFPFWNGFPLLPHLSHSDGKKLDIAFFYVNAKSKEATNEKPSFSGYGIFEAPKAQEENHINYCKSKGYWQYDFAKHLTLGSNPTTYEFDALRTKRMIELFAKEEAIEKMFIEPHLKTRLGLEKEVKIRLHGCQAVRHDDHLHIQMK